MTSDIVPAKQTKSRPAPAESPPAPASVIRWLDGLSLLAFLALTFLLGAFPLKDTDFWWHLRTGDLIRETGTVPTHDLFTYSVPANPWIDLHWIYQLAISYVYQRGGVPALTLAKCGVTTLAVFFLVTARRREWPLWVTLTFWLPALLVLAGRMYVRPETLTLLYLSIFLAVLSRLDRIPLLALCLPMVQVFWVNTQGLFVFGPVFYGIALLDAALRPGAFAANRSRWWRIVGGAGLLVGLACLVNPYGITGALYPLELAGTMRNPVFSYSIAELTPVLEFLRRDHYVTLYSNLSIQLHFLTLALGGAELSDPDRVVGRRPHDRAADGNSQHAGALRQAKECWREVIQAQAKQTPQRRAEARLATEFVPSDSVRRIELLEFPGDAEQSSIRGGCRHNHRLELRGMGGRRASPFLGTHGHTFADVPSRRGIGARLASLLLIVGVFFWVATGGFYAAANEGRTLGLGEQPLWYPHQAVQFAGTEGFPPKFLSFHNGHSSLYDYYYGPERKVFADARLEVIGPQLYSRYIDLQTAIARREERWSRELDEIGRPVILVDLEGNGNVGATLLASPDWRCVWLDELAAVFVHVAYGDVVNEHAIDLGERHFRPEPNTIPRGVDALIASAKGLRNLALPLLGTEHALALMRLARIMPAVPVFMIPTVPNPGNSSLSLKCCASVRRPNRHPGFVRPLTRSSTSQPSERPTTSGAPWNSILVIFWRPRPWNRCSRRAR